MSDSASPFYGNPYAWVWFAVALFVIPALAFVISSEAEWTRIHPAINAMLNGTSGVFLFVGYGAIRTGKRELHKRCMLTAFSASGVFLLSYLARYATTGAHRYPGEGIAKTIYLIILFSHMILAAALVPLVLYTLLHARNSRFAQHKRIARWTFPIWGYVSVTGVIVYVMLYH